MHSWRVSELWSSARDGLLLTYASNANSREEIGESLLNLLAELQHPGESRGRANGLGRRPPTSQEQDRRRVDERIGAFQYAASEPWREIARRFGTHLKQTELLSVAEVLGAQLGITVDREAKRRKEVLIKWFDENWERIKEIWPQIELRDRKGRSMDANPPFVA
jgi:hypothetical protein